MTNLRANISKTTIEDTYVSIDKTAYRPAVGQFSRLVEIRRFVGANKLDHAAPLVRLNFTIRHRRTGVSLCLTRI